MQGLIEKLLHFLDAIVLQCIIFKVSIFFFFFYTLTHNSFVTHQEVLSFPFVTGDWKANQILSIFCRNLYEINVMEKSLEHFQSGETYMYTIFLQTLKQFQLDCLFSGENPYIFNNFEIQ